MKVIVRIGFVVTLGCFSPDRFKDTGVDISSFVTSPYTAPAVAYPIVRNKLWKPELTDVVLMRIRADRFGRI